jgi:hypothetical protein
MTSRESTSAVRCGHLDLVCKGSFVGRATFDLSDEIEIRKYSWGLTSDGYVAMHAPKGRTAVLKMHQLIMGAAPEKHGIDHINGNRLDNRWCNLRFVTAAQNSQNKPKKSGLTSRWTGVSAFRGRWRSQCGTEVIGMFETELAAAWAYDQVALRKYGPGARLNGVSEPAQSAPLPKRSRACPHPGVNWVDSKWRVLFAVDGQRRYFGTHDDLDTAVSIATREMAVITAEKLSKHSMKPITRNSSGQAVIRTKQDDEFIVDDNRWHELTFLTGWYKNSHGYAASSSSKIRTLMHRHIMEAAEGQIIDHVNGNRADNRECNLRIATSTTNSHNRKKKENASSQYKGVRYTSKHRWEATCRANGVQEYLGSYATEEVAAWAYDQRVREIHGMNASCNNVPEPDEFIWANKRAVRKTLDLPEEYLIEDTTKTRSESLSADNRDSDASSRKLKRKRDETEEVCNSRQCMRT